jgi:hypothetical protein
MSSTLLKMNIEDKRIRQHSYMENFLPTHKIVQLVKRIKFLYHQSYS